MIHFELSGKLNGPVPKVVDSREGIAMWEVGLAAPEGGCNIVTVTRNALSIV